MSSSVDHRDGHQFQLVDDLAPRPRPWIPEVGWITRGLARGEQVIVAGDRQLASTTDLVAALTDDDGHRCAPTRRTAVESAADSGRLMVAPAERIYSVAGYTEMVRSGLAAGHPGIRTCGGPAVHAPGAPAPCGNPLAAEYEDVLDELSLAHPVSALCLYPRVMNVNDARWTVARHAHGGGDRFLQAHPAGAVLRLAGEADLSNETLLGAAVADAARRHPELHIDCRALQYAGVGAWRVLLDATAELRATGGRVRLSGLSPVARRVLDLLGPARNLTVDPADDAGLRGPGT